MTPRECTGLTSMQQFGCTLWYSTDSVVVVLQKAFRSHTLRTTTCSSVEHLGVQLTSCMNKVPESSRGVQCEGLPRKTDQFQLDPTQSSALGRWCYHVSSVSSHCIRSLFQHLQTCDQPIQALSRMHTIHHLHSCNHPTHHSYG